MSDFSSSVITDSSSAQNMDSFETSFPTDIDNSFWSDPHLQMPLSPVGQSIYNGDFESNKEELKDIYYIYEDPNFKDLESDNH
ncbi:hypothetical protein QJS04_geneDACA002403 [Acorus gramineus]|uniref:Uncharacterized protein n=1 Tax=Acorus gramineus TaxID=55184 RepID=A0AAV9A975_ACOGR|nr:hypothetical protein QJS04_geneDACA002403 [Acorus gramineus]